MVQPRPGRGIEFMVQPRPGRGSEFKVQPRPGRGIEFMVPPRPGRGTEFMVQPIQKSKEGTINWPGGQLYFSEVFALSVYGEYAKWLKVLENIFFLS